MSIAKFWLFNREEIKSAAAIAFAGAQGRGGGGTFQDYASMLQESAVTDIILMEDDFFLKLEEYL